MSRRTFLGTTAAALGLGGSAARAAKGDFEVTRSEAQWRDMLSEAEFRVMREEGTERAFTSPLHDLKTPGIYQCRGCEQRLYSSEHKFDSGTGWPSFYQPLAESAVGTKPDRSLFITRTEVHCSRCGSHLGHVFDDGPPPTGKRHCINGVSLTFVEA
ncbi:MULTISPECIES: peptide-methionine (R)-S-oxide reductase MsrB [unclassified Roseivivax]|uniref:peptide-methionine (R)-S-oxide reductase MsrB n=1 Tax=Roseivivax sp. GX 12232 TaxID=2900547 RepID=UPI001E4660BE|nr:peptide-methionine (R)-S-oxide reductase MsrB [Roseivivax sp. GX 12232]MCE0504162.1 peptide-methionine (R)-S-oxide reductase MsrB [Roseivivax sp. GX 12232]